MTPNSSSTTSSIPAATPTTTPPTLGRCEIYVHRSAEICSPYISSNKSVFLPKKQSQADVDNFVAQVMQTAQNSDRQCLDVQLNIACNYAFPTCLLPSSWARLCDEDCKRVFSSSQSCSNDIQRLKGAFLASIGVGNEQIQLAKSDLDCTGLPSKKNTACTEIPLLSQSPSPTFTAPTVPGPGNGTCGGTAAVGTPCHFPFTYKGAEYNECIGTGNSSWCATEPGDYETHLQWGFCNCTNRVFPLQCEMYTAGDVCRVRQGKTVLVDVSVSPETVNAELSRLRDIFVPITAILNINISCLNDFLEILCYFAFPSCKSNEPGVSNLTPEDMCRESCYQASKGNCGRLYGTGLEALRAQDLSGAPRFARVGFPVCSDLEDKSQNPHCMDPGISFGYTPETPTSAPPVFTTRTPVTSKPPSSISTTIIAATAAGVGSLLIFIIIVTVFCVATRRRRQRSKTLALFPSYSYSVNDRTLNDYSGPKLSVRDGNVEVLNANYEPMTNKDGGVMTMKQALRNNESGVFDVTSLMASGAKTVQEISSDDIRYIRDLGQGEFGMVFLGEIANKTLVAVKILKDDADEKSREEFTKELCIMSQLEHPNIIRLLAQCTRKTSPTECLIFEFMCHGDLGEFLRKSLLGDATVLRPESDEKHELGGHDLLFVIVQLCQACAYLEEKRFVHRDIATRNCLIGDNLVAKVADFGMSRDIYSSDYYRIGGKALLPVRWMPPESVMYGRFTLKSDVWSFGVLMWEVCTLGKQPYYGKTNEQVVKAVVNGDTLTEPDELRLESLYDIMKTCWRSDPNDRPTFAHLLTTLQEL
ncbi:muscle, skeletal receptor tyrosine protein kinase-like isoform X2 [Oscarella lobularis]